MPGLFTQAAGVLAARDAGQHDAELEAERKRRQQQDDSDHAIQRAAMMAALGNQGIVSGANRANVPNEVAHGSLTLPATPDLTKADQTDVGRYNDLGGGYYQDKTKTSDAIQSRALAKQEQTVQRRIATLKATRAELRALPDEQVRAIAEDEKSYGEYMKPTPPEIYRPVPDGSTTLYGEHTGSTRPTGQAPRPKAPVLGTPEYRKAQSEIAADRAAASGNKPAGESSTVKNTRADLAVMQARERRGEHAVTFAKSDRTSFLRDHPGASDPMSEQKTRADSDAVRSMRSLDSTVNAKERDLRAATSKSDSTLTALEQQRQADNGRATGRAGLQPVGAAAVKVQSSARPLQRTGIVDRVEDSPTGPIAVVEITKDGRQTFVNIPTASLKGATEGATVVLPDEPPAGKIAPDSTLVRLDKQFGGNTQKIKAELRRLGFRDDQ